MSLRLQAPVPAAVSAKPVMDLQGAVARSAKPRAGWLVGRPFLITVIVVSLLINGYGLIFRLPLLQPGMGVQAREGAGWEDIGFQAMDAGRLRGELRLARAALLQDRAEFLTAMSGLERVAAKHGWTINSVIRPAESSTGELQVRRLPVEITLTDREATDSVGALHRLEPVIRQLDLANRRVEIRELALRGGPNGLSGLNLELHFWINDEHETPVAE